MADERNPQVDLAGLVENAFLMGIGVLEMTREKVTGMTDDLIERGKMSQSEAKKVADRISSVASQQQDAVRRTVADETHKALDLAGLATREEVASLRGEIAELKAMIAAMRPGGPGEESVE